MLPGKAVARMKEWGPWDWIAFSALWIGAAILAADAAIKGSKTFRENLGWLIAKPLWPFLPLIFVGLGTAIYLLGSVNIIPFATKAKQEVFAFQKWPAPYHPEVITGERFVNSEVLLDGKSYIRCTFENVTFKYNGTTAIQLTNNRILGKITFSTDNPAVLGAMFLLQGLGATRMPFDVIGKNAPNVEFPVQKEPQNNSH